VVGIGDDDEQDPAASPPLLTRTMMARDAVPGLASATQTFTDLDHQRISMQAVQGLEVLDRPSLLWELEPRPSAPAPGPPGQPSSLSQPGEKRAKYETVAEIGKGGMGDVFEVADVDLRRTVALKRIRQDMLSPRSIALFLQEAQITAQLEHPNIVPVHDSGRTKTGEAFFTMKLLRGHTLRQVLHLLGNGERAAVQRFTPIRMGIIFLEVVRAVSYAHKRGVVHCDLKPSNVLIGEHSEVVVGDWGLARRDILAPPGPDTALVRFPPDAPDFKGIISGSIPYMAPEQVTTDDIAPRRRPARRISARRA